MPSMTGKREAGLNELRATVHDMADALRAAAEGHLEPARAFLAAGVLGIRDLEPGGAVIPFRTSSESYTHGFDASFRNRVRHIVSIPDDATVLVIRRLYVPEDIAPRVRIVDVEIGVRRVLGQGGQGSFPGTMFAKRYGPLFKWIIQDREDITVNFLADGCDVLILALGYYGVPHRASAESLP